MYDKEWSSKVLEGSGRGQFQGTIHLWRQRKPRMSTVKAVTAWFEMHCRKFPVGTDKYHERLMSV